MHRKNDSSTTRQPRTNRVQAALEQRFPDGRWLPTLEVLRPTGVADYGQIQAETGLSRGKLDAFITHARELSGDGILSEVPFAVPRPGKRGRPSIVYRLGETGAQLLRANGHDDAHPCGLNTETTIGHARGVLDVRLAAQAEGLAVTTERTLCYTDGGDECVLRPDNLITLSGGVQALFETEQRADLTLLRRIRENVRNKLAFFTAPEAAGVSRHVRVLIDLPEGPAWDQTVAVWERASAIAAEESGGRLPFHIAAMPMLDFLAHPDWAEPPDEPRWESLFDPAQTAAFGPTVNNEEKALVRAPKKTPRRADIPPGLARRSARDDFLIMEAFWSYLQQEGRSLLYVHERPQAHPAFFQTMMVIYAASHPPDATPWERALHPHASLYLLQQYLRMHPQLHKALSKAVARGGGSTKWTIPTIVHRMQTVARVFLRYHGLRSGGALRTFITGSWDRNNEDGDFSIQVSIEPEVLMGLDDGVVPTREDARAAEEALSWVLTALFAYAEDINIRHARFW